MRRLVVSDGAGASAPRTNIRIAPIATHSAFRFALITIAVRTIANGTAIANGRATRWKRFGATKPSRRSGSARVDHGAAKLRSGKGNVNAIGTTAATDAPRAIHSMMEETPKSSGNSRKGIA